MQPGAITLKNISNLSPLPSLLVHREQELHEYQQDVEMVYFRFSYGFKLSKAPSGGKKAPRGLTSKWISVDKKALRHLTSKWTSVDDRKCRKNSVRSHFEVNLPRQPSEPQSTTARGDKALWGLTCSDVEEIATSISLALEYSNAWWVIMGGAKKGGGYVGTCSWPLAGFSGDFAEQLDLTLINRTISLSAFVCSSK